MLSRSLVLMLAFVVVATTGMLGIAPRPAEARDTGRIVAGIAAGALVYGLLDRPDTSRAPSRGYYDGNRGSWMPSRPSYRPPRQPSYRPAPPRRTPSYDYRRGYDHGHRDGYDRGHRVGYDRGYDHGYRDGYRDGTRSPWGCWGY